ncbi:SCO family protein [Oceanobacillus manasiensis]|uniref:SCO family protein n=1 Tax=Oceanobacillus manasiensis TaxID=586413 RepID=UPI0005AAE235|nr:SCO family protein [Oceanobacillus manasiensis]
MNIRYIAYIVFCLIILSACNANQPIEKKIDSFSFTDQNNQPFGITDLSESIWISNFIFTSCETVCPRMTSEMASLQKTLKKEGIEVEFVSFSVDPEVDSPEILKEYINQYTDNETNWHMLTGYTQKEIEAFAREQFQTIVQKPDTSNQVIHGTTFYLIDDRGFILNEYNYVDDSYEDEIINDIKEIS